MMNLENYQWGARREGDNFQYYLPENINHAWKWEQPEINNLLEQASLKLGELNSFAKLVPNIDLFIRLYATTEAVISSRIEGTQTNIGEALFSEDQVKPERRADWKEVSNYTNALNNGIHSLENLPISSRLVRKVHKILLTGVRGKGKLPGEYRKSQNWIGGTSIENAVFIPPAPHHVDDLMNDLEQFIHNDKIKVPLLIRIGMVHYQFETIHPFLDGNGRIGRLLITLYLIDKKIIEKPLLYLSKFFERRKGVYYECLMRVRENNDMMQWLQYFLTGIRDTAVDAVETLQSVMQLKNNSEAQIREQWGRRTRTALVLLEHLFTEPAVQIKDVQKVCNLSARAAGRLVESFEEAGFVEETTGQRRNRIYLFKLYLKEFN